MLYFVLCRNDDLLIFRTKDAAETYMESPDIEQGEYVAAFDGSGEKYAIESPRSREGRFFGLRTVEPHHGVLNPIGVSDPDQLKHLILKFLKQSIESDKSLADLTYEVARFAQ